MNSALIGLIAVVLLVPLVRRAFARRLDPFEPIVVFAVSWAVMFVLRPAAELMRGEPLYVRPTGLLHVQDTFTEALGLALVGAIAFVTAYEFDGGRRLAVRMPAPPRRFSAGLTLVGIAGVTAVSVIAFSLFLSSAGALSRSGFEQLLGGRSYELTEAQKGATYLWQMSMGLVPAALGLLAVAWSRRSLFLWLLLPGLVALVLVRALPVGSRMMLLPFGGGTIIYTYLVRGRRPTLVQMVVVAIVGLVASHLVLQTRGGGQRGGPLPLRDAVADLARSPSTLLEPLTEGNDTEMVVALAAALQVVPEEVPFAYGRGILGDLFARPIPRSLWRDKPIPPREQVISWLWPAEYSTHVANPEFSVLLAFYLEFGVVGVLAGMAVYGVLARSGFEYFRRHHARTATRLLYALGLPFLVIALRDSPVDLANRAAFMWLPLLGILRLARLRPGAGPRPVLSRRPVAPTGAASVRAHVGVGGAIIVLVAALEANASGHPCMPALHDGRGGPRSSRQVFAHYFSPFPLSFDNADPAHDTYARAMTPEGDQGRFRDVGGYLRERPLPRAPRAESDWWRRDVAEEVRQAASIGLDGFAFDMLHTSGPNRDRLEALLEIAPQVAPGFRILLMPDMNAEFRDVPERMVPALAAVAHERALVRDGAGRLVVAPFNAAAQSPVWWGEQLARLRSLGVPVMFLPVFLDWKRSAPDYLQASNGLSWWGPRTPTRALALDEDARAARRLGGFWMAPVAPQDFRPKSAIFFEAGGSELFRRMWEGAIRGGADWVQVISWNDYSEGTEIAPSTGIGYAFADLTAYYAAWFKQGGPPRIPYDILYYFHRVQLANPSRAGRLQAKPIASTGPDAPRDEMELLALLASPGEIEISIGDQLKRAPAPAGLTSLRVRLAPGRPRFALRRAGRTVLSGESDWTITTDYAYQDLLYRAGCVDNRPEGAR